MQISPAAEVAALVLTVLVHVLGAGVLIWGMIDRDDPDSRASWGDFWPRDDDGPRPTPPAPQPSGTRERVPLLPDAAPAAVRFREGARLGDLTPSRERRPAHPPAPVREPARERETA